MLTIYRRHLERCAHKKKGRDWRKCQCPIWVDGVLNGRDIRFSLKTLNWELAAEKALQIESGKEKPVTIQDAGKEFQKHIKLRNLSSDVLYRYKTFIEELENFAARKGIKYLSNLDVPTMRAWQSELQVGAATARKRIERMRTFLRFCFENGWIDKNSALILQYPKSNHQPTLPFTDKEWKAILKACDEYPTLNSYGYDNRARMKAFVLLMRYSGLRISDAFTLHKSKLTGNRLLLYTQKTGTPVHLPLPPEVIKALKAVEQKNGFYFYSGNTAPQNVIARMGKSLRRLFKLSKVKDAHSHRFRDSFAVGLLQKGVSLEDVAILLGNTIKICERHYSPWVQARQDRLEKLVLAAYHD